MWLDEIDKEILSIVELVRPDIKGEMLKRLRNLRNITIEQTIFEFSKGMDSLKAHIEKHVDRPLKDNEEQSDDVPPKESA